MKTQVNIQDFNIDIYSMTPLEKKQYLITLILNTAFDPVTKSVDMAKLVAGQETSRFMCNMLVPLLSFDGTLPKTMLSYDLHGARIMYMLHGYLTYTTQLYGDLMHHPSTGELHGTRHPKVDGNVYQGVPIVIISGITNSPNGLVHAYSFLAEKGYKVIGALSLIDYGAVPVGEILTSYGVEYRTLVTMQQIIASYNARKMEPIPLLHTARQDWDDWHRDLG